MNEFPATPQAPLSWGELIDRITILDIKNERLATAQARANAARELALLREIAGPVFENVKDLASQLKALNQTLWDIEDRIRDHERRSVFDGDFVALARSVYMRNDERGRIKREINLALGSGLIEEKNYQPY